MHSKKLKLRILDEDVCRWVKTLHEGGFYHEEMENFLASLNHAYKIQKNAGHIQREVEKTIGNLRKDYGKVVSEKEIERIIELVKRKN